MLGALCSLIVSNRQRYDKGKMMHPRRYKLFSMADTFEVSKPHNEKIPRALEMPTAWCPGKSTVVTDLCIYYKT